MSQFISLEPTLDAYWRAIILFGRNVASYKFALGKTLLDLAATDKTFVALEELALPFAQHVIAHLSHTDTQGTFQTSRFLDACRAFMRGTLTQDALRATTVRAGFNNVIDAFHIVNHAEVGTRFFVDERRDRKGLTLTDALLALRSTPPAQDFVQEIEARWRLVETAWSLGLSPHVLMVQFDRATAELFINVTHEGRRDITSCRDALNGYQKGTCFYCYSPIRITPGLTDCDVDHFFPRLLVATTAMAGINLDGVWNLVLACQRCNRGVAGKFARVPALTYLERLHRKNTYLIESHHPLRETLMRQTGATEEARRHFLQVVDTTALSCLMHRWQASDEGTPTF